MKEYRITAWAKPKAPFTGSAHRRMLSDMSHRYVSLDQLTQCSGLRRQEVEQFLQSLQGRELLIERELFLNEPNPSWTKSASQWFRRTFKLN
jgi:hypothetical protein